MAREFPALPILIQPPVRLTPPPRVCIVSYEFVGLTKNGGIGTAYTSLAESLAAAGLEVSCLFVGEVPTEGPGVDHWVSAYRAKGIRLEIPPATNLLHDSKSHFARSFDVYQWFKRSGDFDIVHFPELLASGFHTLEAKRQGLILAHTFVCVGIHSMTLWLRTAMQEWNVGVIDLELDYMERRSVELADSVVSPSQYLLNWIAEQGWVLPGQALVQPYVQPKLARSTLTSRVTKPVSEFVFFGRLETRKGIALFCDALDRLAPTSPLPNQVTFLGRENVVEGRNAREYIESRAKRWPFPTQLLTKLDQPEAIAYLRGTGRMAVIPSLMENSPNTVYECLGSNIPFLASRAGGIPELICPEDAADICFDLNPGALSQRMTRALKEGVATSRNAVDVAANETAWIEWHRQTAAAMRAPAAEQCAKKSPLVTVCIPTFNRPALLQQALESIRMNDYPHLEVVVVDDGSFLPEAVEHLASLEPTFRERGWTLIRQENRFTGAARNAAAQAAKGDYLFFMDDDDVSFSRQLSMLVAVAERADCDLVTSGAGVWEGTQAPSQGAVPKRGSLPLGNALAVGTHYNCFGEGNLLVKRSTFMRLGGFTEDFGIAGEEAEFYAQAGLSGATLAVIPEFLYWRREHPHCLRASLRSQPVYSRRRLRPYERVVPPSLRTVIGMGSSYLQRERSRAPGEYEILSLAWRSKFEAGRMLAQMNQRQAAERAYTEAIKSVETSKHWAVILEALLAVGEAMRAIDVRRASVLAQMAQQIAALSPYEHHRQQAAALLATVGARAPVNPAKSAALQPA